MTNNFKYRQILLDPKKKILRLVKHTNNSLIRHNQTFFSNADCVHYVFS